MKWKTENGKWRTDAFIVFAFLLLFLASCTSHKKVVIPKARIADYQWMSAKMSGEVKDDSLAYDFSGNIRMHRDSTVWISVSSTMGMEGARILVTQDSIVVVNRMDKTYLAEPFAALMETQDITSLQELQAKLLGDGDSEQVTLQWGPYTASVSYFGVQWDKPLSFPIKINKKYERIKL